jgi:hypothetical protein
MGEATPEELAEMGVTITDPPPAPQPERVPFEQVDTLPDEPKTDVKIRLESGEEFRERMVQCPIEGEKIAPGAANGFNFSFSNALLESDGSVATFADGTFKIVPQAVRHELRLTGEDIAAMLKTGGREAVETAIQHAREVAAAKALDYFKGMDLGRELFGDRIADPVDEEVVDLVLANRSPPPLPPGVESSPKV